MHVQQAAPKIYEFDVPDVAPGSGQLRLLGLLRDIRVAAHEVRNECLAILAAAAPTEDPTSHDARIVAATKAAASTRRRASAWVHQRLRSLRAVLDTDGQLYDWAGDDIATISGLWAKVDEEWPDADLPADEILRRADSVRQRTEDVLYNASLLTVPPRLEAHLSSMRVGGVLDFAESFGDELPEADDRARLLRYISSHPRLVSGMVDVENGLVYKASRHRPRRIASLVMALAVVVAGGAMAWGLDAADMGIGDKPTHLFVAYLFIVLGASVHLLVAGLKRTKASPAGRLFASFDDLLLWVHVREVSVVVGALSLWVGVVGLAFVQPDAQWQEGFFVGYSIDSFVELFVKRFEGIATAQVSAISKALAAEGKA